MTTGSAPHLGTIKGVDGLFKSQSDLTLVKVDDELGVVFGFAIVSTIDGVPYYDKQGDHIDDASLTKAALEFCDAGTAAKVMHQGYAVGTVPFVFPLTAEICKALNITSVTNGLLVGLKPDAVTLALIKDGTYPAFSIGGERLKEVDV